jgi:hypothetical protein
MLGEEIWRRLVDLRAYGHNLKPADGIDRDSHSELRMHPYQCKSRFISIKILIVILGEIRWRFSMKHSIIAEQRIISGFVSIRVL